MEIDNDSDSVGSVSADGAARDFSSVEGGEESGSVSSEDENSDSLQSASDEELFNWNLEDIKGNEPYLTVLEWYGFHDFIQNITNEQWEKIGRDISNNTHLERLELPEGALNDDKASYLFRGLTRSSSIKESSLHFNGLGAVVVRSMVQFLQNASSIRTLHLGDNNIRSEGFNFLCRTLRDSPIEELYCYDCGIESIEIDANNFPRKLTLLHLAGNSINADGCREITKLLQGGESTLERLYLGQNNIDDECIAILVNALRSNTTLTALYLDRNMIGDAGVAILVDILQSNTTLTTLYLNNNKVGDKCVAILVDALRNNTSLKSLKLGGNDISDRGETMLLKLVNDVSSINATFQSNHTLTDITFVGIDIDRQMNPTDIDRHINRAIKINEDFKDNPETAGREKIIQTQLHSATRAELAKLHGVSQSLYSEINPLHLPEVLSLIVRSHGQGELFDALKTSIAGVISIVDRKHCIEPLVDLGKTKSAEPHAERAGNDEAEVGVTHAGDESCSNKRRRE